MSDSFNIYCAESGKRVPELPEVNPRPEIILLDLIMNNMNGHELYNILKKRKQARGVPVIFLTANKAMTEKIKGLKEGAADFITKPFCVEELTQRIHSILENHAHAKKEGKLELKGRILKTLGEEETHKEFLFEQRCKYYNITKRQKEVLVYVLKGMKYERIATTLFISIVTVKKHMYEVYKKSKVQNKIELFSLFKQLLPDQ